MSTTAWRMTHIFPVGQRIITPDALGFIENICIFAAITLKGQCLCNKKI